MNVIASHQTKISEEFSHDLKDASLRLPWVQDNKIELIKIIVNQGKAWRDGNF